MGVTRIIDGTYLQGYMLSNAYRILSITSTAYIEGSGLIIPSHAPDIVAVYNLGSIFNTGSDGPAAMVTLDGVSRFVNGDAADTSVAVVAYNTAVYAGAPSQYSRVVNYGTLLGEGGKGSNYFPAGVFLNSEEGSIRNGTVSDTTALIQGGAGVYIRADGIVANYGTIRASIRNRDAVVFEDGGSFTNGSAQDVAALAIGQSGFAVTGGSGELVNFGVVQGGYHNTAVILDDGGSVDNYGRIKGPAGVAIGGGAGTVVNTGRIVGYTYAGLSVQAGGTIVNGSASDQTALIDGHLVGVDLSAGGALTNFGVIAGDVSGYEFAVSMNDGATLVNGSAADRAAIIEGYRGLDLLTLCSASNYGLIEGLGAYGAVVANLSQLVNGAPGDRSALIEGPLGVNLASRSQLTNFGTIEGTGGEAVDMDATSTLVVEPQSVFLGTIVGHLGALDLAAGDGTLSFGNYDNVVVSGSMATTTFSDFGTIEIAPQASFAAPADQSIDSLQRLIDKGTITIGGTLTGAGVVSVFGSLAGGTLALPTYGYLALHPGADLTLAQVLVSGGTVAVATSLAFAGVWAQTAGELDVTKGTVFDLKGAADAFAGAVEGLGEVAVTGTLTVGAAGGLVKSGAMLKTTDLASNAIVGASPAATLTNRGAIEGAGRLGGGTMSLVNASGGLILTDDADAMTIDTGANTIQNAGLIKNVGAGGMVIASPIANSGTLLAGTSGTLTLEGLVTGGGKVQINGGTLYVEAAFDRAVTFTGTTGTLKLGDSRGFTGEIADFSKTGTERLDLADIAFGSTTTKASYSGTTAGGTLTVTDGTHTARIALMGNYTTAAWTLSSDGHGGTDVVDPTDKPAALSSAPHPPSPGQSFVQALTTFAVRGDSAPTIAANQSRAPPQLLATPGLHAPWASP